MFGERLVTILAVLFELGVPLDQVAGHNKLFENALRARCPHCGGDQERDDAKAKKIGGFHCAVPVQ